jgi:hypothetical protein
MSSYPAVFFRLHPFPSHSQPLRSSLSNRLRSNRIHAVPATPIRSFPQGRIACDALQPVESVPHRMLLWFPACRMCSFPISSHPMASCASFGVVTPQFVSNRIQPVHWPRFLCGPVGRIVSGPSNCLLSGELVFDPLLSSPAASFIFNPLRISPLLSNGFASSPSALRLSLQSARIPSSLCGPFLSRPVACRRYHAPRFQPVQSVGFAYIPIQSDRFASSRSTRFRSSTTTRFLDSPSPPVRCGTSRSPCRSNRKNCDDPRPSRSVHPCGAKGW